MVTFNQDGVLHNLLYSTDIGIVEKDTLKITKYIYRLKNKRRTRGECNPSFLRLIELRTGPHSQLENWS